MNPKSLLLLAAIAFVGLAGCKPRFAPEPPRSRPSLLRISQRNEPADLDPALAPLPDEFFIIRTLSEGLVFPAMPDNPSLAQPTPAAASSWSVSPDGLTWTFHLRPEARWSNGDPVTAADFIASFRRVLTPATAAPRAELFFPVRNARAFLSGALKDFAAVGFSAPDPLTLVVRLDHPQPDFLAYAASGPWIPVNPAVVTRWGRAWTQPQHYVGNGPYVLAEWSPHVRIVVRRNPRYREAEASGSGGDAASTDKLSPPALPEEIQFIRFDDGNTEERAFRSGEIDVTMAVPADRMAAYEKLHPAQLHHAPLAETRYLAFNTTHAPLDRVDVRRALSLAIDRRRLVRDVLRGGQHPAGHLLPFGGVPAAELAPTADPVQARALLAAAGFPGGRGFPRLELSGWSGNAGDLALESIQEMWRQDLGVTTVLATRDARAHIAALRSGDYDIGLVALIPWVPDAGAVLSDFTSDSPDNYPHWRDARFDAALAAGRTGEALRRMDEEMPVAPLYFNEHNWLMRADVRGWEENPFWERYYLLLRLGGGAR